MVNVKNSYWVKSGFYSLGSKLSLLFFGFGSFYLLVRHLPQIEFGSWALFLTITTIIESSRNGLIQNALIKLLYSHDGVDAHKVVTSSWFINTFYSVLIYLVLVAISGGLGILFKSPDIQMMFVCYGITVILLIPFSQFNFLQQAKFSFSGIFWSTFARQASFFALIVMVYYFEWHISLVTIVLFQSLSTFIGLIVAFFCAWKYIQFKFEFDWTIIKKAFHFGKFVMGTNLCSLVFKSTDQLMLGFLLNPGLVALYNSAIRLSNLIEYPTTSVAEVVYPKSAANFEKDGESSSKTFFEKSVGLTMALTLPLVIITFVLADYIILIIAGPLYAQSADVLRVTILFGIFSPFMRQFGTAMDSSGRPHINFIVLSCAVVITLICNFVFIKAFGIMGAAYGTFCSYVAITLICYMLMIRIFKIKLVNIYLYMIGYFSHAFSLIRNPRRKIKKYQSG